MMNMSEYINEFLVTAAILDAILDFSDDVTY